MLVRGVVLLVVLMAGCSCDGGADATPDAGIPPTSRDFIVTPRRLLANGVSRAYAIVRLSEDGVPLANQPVVITTDGVDTIEPASGMTNERGEFIATVTSTQLGPRTVIATSGTRAYSAMLMFTEPCAVPLLPDRPDFELTRILAGDFNRDYVPDLVGVISGGVGFASGNGDGSFQPVELVPASVGIAPLVSGDFNGDGIVDLAGTTYAGTEVFVLPGLGDGTYDPPLTSPISFNAGTLAAGDFDHDGKLDLAATTATPTPPPIAVLFGKGDGRFDPEVQLATNGALQINNVLVAADLDGDGNDDLVYSDFFTNHLVLYRSVGNRTFTRWPDWPLPSGGVGAITTADFDGNGREDVALALYQPAGALVMRSRGDGTFDPGGGHVLGFKGAAIDVGDYNNDGHLDMVSSDEYNLFVSLGNAQYGVDAATTYGVPFGAAGLQGADFNSDGKRDLALDFGKTSIIDGNGLGGFVLPPPQIAVPIKSIAVGDFDKDGKQDIATVPPVDSNGIDPPELWVRRGNGDGTFATQTIYTTSERPEKVVAADMNGDTWTDLVTLNDYDVNVFLNQQNGTFATPLSVLAAPAPNRRWGYTVGDFNNDGKLDIAATRQILGPYDSKLDVALGNGNGTFGMSIEYPKLDGNPEFLATGDVNEDGKLDIVGFPLELYLGNGNGTFAAPTSLYLGGAVYNGGVVLSDLTGDGHLDIIATAVDLELHEGNGDGTFDPPRVLAPQLRANPELVIDLDKDGYLDIIAAGDLRTFVILGRFDGTFEPPILYRTGFTPSFDRSSPADFNGDTLPDLATPGGILMQRACSS